MTVLSACAEAAIELNQPEPSSLFSTTDQFAKELRTQANRAATAIAKAYDWQKLTALHTLTGDGLTTAFTLPSDYDRMPLKSNVLTSQFASGLRKARDLDQWLDFQLRPFIGSPGSWIILNGAMQVLPAIGTGVTAKFYYIKNTIVTGAASAAQTGFVADADTFNLPERLLTLGVIWRWRSQKRLEYSEDMRNFEIALAEETARDKGSRVLTVGQQRLPVGAELAHPAIIV
jgi:hypothetical protein